MFKYLFWTGVALVGCLVVYLVVHGNSIVEKLHASTPKDALATVAEALNKDGSTETWMSLKQAYMSDGVQVPTLVDVHTLAHVIGAALYREHGNLGLQICDDSFTQGCFHGFIGELIKESGRIVPEDIVTACMQTALPESCAHGAGHGIYEALGERTDSLEICKQFPNKLAPTCIEAVFMQSAWSRNPNQAQIDPWAPCRGIDTVFKTACAVSVGNYFGEFGDRKYSIEYGSSRCRLAPTLDMRHTCLERLGQSALRKSGGNLEQATAMCGTLPTVEQDSCESGATDLYRARYLK